MMVRFLHTYLPTRTVFLGISEALIATLALFLAMLTWLGTLDMTIMLNYERGFAKIAVIVSVLLLCMYYFDLYDSTVLSNRREIFTRMIQVLGTLCILIAAIYSVFPRLNVGRPVFLISVVITGAGLLAVRRLFLAMNGLPSFAERVIVLGDGRLAESLIEQLKSRPELGMRVVAHALENQACVQDCTEPEAFAQDICRTVATQEVHRVIVAMPERRGHLPMDALLAMKTHGIAVQDATELYEVITGKIALESLRPSWLVFSPGFQVSRSLLVYKRISSILLSAFCLLLAAPLMLLIAVAIRIDSRGPIIFRQTRLGKNGKLFTLYKFRSMHDGVDPEGEFKPASDRDERCTRIGRFLRRSRLDELPQLFNIISGEMYFVGPRPFVPNQENEYARRIPFYKQRWTVKPGATGWAQVNRDYCTTLEDNAEKLAYDLFYIKNLSIGLDLLILLKTIKILLLGKGGR